MPLLPTSIAIDQMSGPLWPSNHAFVLLVRPTSPDAQMKGSLPLTLSIIFERV